MLLYSWAQLFIAGARESAGLRARALNGQREVTGCQRATSAAGSALVRLRRRTHLKASCPSNKCDSLWSPTLQGTRLKARSTTKARDTTNAHAVKQNPNAIPSRDKLPCNYRNDYVLCATKHVYPKCRCHNPVRNRRYQRHGVIGGAADHRGSFSALWKLLSALTLLSPLRESGRSDPRYASKEG